MSSPPSAADSESYDERPAKIQKPKPKQKPKSQPQPQHKSAAKPVTLKKSKKPAAADSPSDDEMNSSSPSSEVNHPESLTAKTREVTQAHSTATKNKAKPHPVKRSPVELEEEDNDEQTASKTLKLDDDSDSDLSSLLDEAPVSRKGQKAQKAKRPSHQSNSTKKTSSSKSQAKTDADIDPDQAEIKRLQGWLTKCGIRKMWYKELQPYDTARAKIKHLKEMLSEAGMTGRYSIEKANQIRDARELAADIEEVQAGAERWGKEGDTGQDRGRNSAEDEIKPGRRLIRGARNYDFLSSDGEETD